MPPPTTHELNLIRTNALVDLAHAGLARAYVAARRAKRRLHARQHELAQVAILDTARHKRHRDVALDAIYAHPRRHEYENACNEVDERVAGI